MIELLWNTLCIILCFRSACCGRNV